MLAVTRAMAASSGSPHRSTLLNHQLLAGAGDDLLTVKVAGKGGAVDCHGGTRICQCAVWHEGIKDVIDVGVFDWCEHTAAGQKQQGVQE